MSTKKLFNNSTVFTSPWFRSSFTQRAQLNPNGVMTIYTHRQTQYNEALVRCNSKLQNTKTLTHRSTAQRSTVSHNHTHNIEQRTRHSSASITRMRMCAAVCEMCFISRSQDDARRYLPPSTSQASRSFTIDIDYVCSHCGYTIVLNSNVALTHNNAIVSDTAQSPSTPHPKFAVIVRVVATQRARSSDKWLSVCVCKLSTKVGIFLGRLRVRRGKCRCATRER